MLLHGPAFRSLVCGGQMTQLNLSHATNLTAEDIGAIRSHVALCTTINLSCCDQLDDGALLLLLSTDLPALTSLNCSQTELAGNALVEYACHVPNLLHLSVANTRTFTTAAVSALGRHCPCLTSLDLTNCTKLGDSHRRHHQRMHVVQQPAHHERVTEMELKPRLKNRRAEDPAR